MELFSIAQDLEWETASKQVATQHKLHDRQLQTPNKHKPVRNAKY